MVRNILININERLAKLGVFITAYGGCVFLCVMLVSVFYIALFSCYETWDSDHCKVMSHWGVIIVCQIVGNLALFHYHSRHNCVSHWQRESCVADLCKTLNEIDESKQSLLEDTLWMEEGDSIRTTDLGKGRYCTKCSRNAPIRSHHCPLCNICVLRKDHHCFVTGACVGLGNQRYFIVFLFWACIGLLVGMKYILVYLNQSVGSDSMLPFPFRFIFYIGPISIIRWLFGYADLFHAVVCSVFSFSAASFVAALGFFGMQIYYTSYGYTMYEYHNGNFRATYDGDGDSVGERFSLIFGRYWLANFVFPLIWNPPLLTPQIATNLFRVRSKLL